MEEGIVFKLPTNPVRKSAGKMKITWYAEEPLTLEPL